MGKHKRYHPKNHPQSQASSSNRGKSHFSNGVRLLMAFAVLAIVAFGVFYAISSAQPPSSPGTSLSTPYPQNVAPTFYSTPTLSSGGAKVSIPSSSVSTSKLVFVDLKLAQTTDTLEYQGRTIPLSIYKGGNYLPLVLISTPSGNTVAGVRVCEPCGSFNFHIVQGQNLKCDVCGTEWNVETFAPISGGCQPYPPPKLQTTTANGSIDVDLSSLGTIVAA